MNKSSNMPLFSNVMEIVDHFTHPLLTVFSIHKVNTVFIFRVIINLFWFTKCHAAANDSHYVHTMSDSFKKCPVELNIKRVFLLRILYLLRKKRNRYQITLLSVRLSVKSIYLRNAWKYRVDEITLEKNLKTIRLWINPKKNNSLKGRQNLVLKPLVKMRDQMKGPWPR